MESWQVYFTKQDTKYHPHDVITYFSETVIVGKLILP